MADPIDTRQLDKRVAHRYLRKGVLDEKDYAQHLKSLDDLADRAAPVEASMENDDLDDLDDVDEDDEGEDDAQP